MRKLLRLTAAAVRAVLVAASLHAGATAASAVVVDGVAAVVNGEVITLLELEKAGRMALEERLHAVPAGDQARVRHEVLSTVLNQLVLNRIQAQRAREFGVQIAPEEVDAAIAGIREENRLSDELLARALQERGMTMEEYRREIEDQLRLSRLVQREIRAKVTATDEEVAAWFQAHRTEWGHPERIRVRHLLIPLPAEPTADEVEAARALAETLLAQTRGGAEFAAIVRARTPGAAEDADPVSAELTRGELFPALEQTAFALPVGGVGGPVRGPAGFYLVQVAAKTPAYEPRLEEVRASIEQKIVERKTRERFDGWLKQLRANAIVEIRF